MNDLGKQRRRKEMCDMQTLDASENERSDARAAVGELSPAAEVGVHAGAVNVRATSASDGEGGCGARHLAVGAEVSRSSSARIWLHICREGGTWTVGEVAKQFGLPFTTANTTLRGLASRAMLHRTSGQRPAKFSVTPSCTVPVGVSLSELADACAFR